MITRMKVNRVKLVRESVFEQIPNIGPDQIPEYYLQEQIDQIEYQIIQNLLFE